MERSGVKATSKLAFLHDVSTYQSSTHTKHKDHLNMLIDYFRPKMSAIQTHPNRWPKYSSQAINVLSQISCQTHTRMCLSTKGMVLHCNRASVTICLQTCFALLPNMLQMLCKPIVMCVWHHSNHLQNPWNCVANMLQMCCKSVANCNGFATLPLCYR